MIWPAAFSYWTKVQYPHLSKFCYSNHIILPLLGLSEQIDSLLMVPYAAPTTETLVEDSNYF